MRKRFPGHDPYRAWANFEFIADDGSVNEVDLLVFSPQGFFLIEIKSRPGRLLGDAGILIPTASAASANPLAAKPSQFSARAKHIIHIYLNGGPSQMDTFDPKPALTKWADKLIPTGNLTTERPTGAGKAGIPVRARGRLLEKRATGVVHGSIRAAVGPAPRGQGG